jgi:hypothetical protein
MALRAQLAGLDWQGVVILGDPTVAIGRLSGSLPTLAQVIAGGLLYGSRPADRNSGPTHSALATYGVQRDYIRGVEKTRQVAEPRPRPAAMATAVPRSRGADRLRDRVDNGATRAEARRCGPCNPTVGVSVTAYLKSLAGPVVMWVFISAAP